MNQAIVGLFRSEGSGLNMTRSPDAWRLHGTMIAGLPSTKKRKTIWQRAEIPILQANGCATIHAQGKARR
jgi:hypothetical protein